MRKGILLIAMIALCLIIAKSNLRRNCAEEKGYGEVTALAVKEDISLSEKTHEEDVASDKVVMNLIVVNENVTALRPWQEYASAAPTEIQVAATNDSLLRRTAAGQECNICMSKLPNISDAMLVA